MRIVTLMAVGFTSLLISACSGPESNRRTGETISREEFLNAYFELRRAGLRSRGMDLTLDERDSVLAKLELTEEDLLAFVDASSADGEVMLAIWEEVDSLMRATRTRTDQDFDPELDDSEIDDPELDDPGGTDPNREVGGRGGVDGP